MCTIPIGAAENYPKATTRSKGKPKIVVYRSPEQIESVAKEILIWQ
jgi:hypothetical protein